MVKKSGEDPYVSIQLGEILEKLVKSQQFENFATSDVRNENFRN